MKEHFVVFSHGFGVDKSDRGLFNDVLDGLVDVTGVMFNYNEIAEGTGDMTVRPLSEQAEILGQVIATLKRHGAVIDLICHSQGCVAAALSKPVGIRKVILIAPPLELDAKQSSRRWSERPGSEINQNGVSKLKRADGSTTLVPAEFWAEWRSIDVVSEYDQLAKSLDVTFIIAQQDDVHPDQDTGVVSEISQMLVLPGDHNFSAPTDRANLVKTVAGLLAEK